MWKTATPTVTPDAGNMPRVDPETGNGIITDVCLKRKIRNYVQDVKEDESGWRIYIKDQVPLNRSDLEAGEALGIGEELAEIQKGKDAKKIVTKLRSNDPDIDLKLRDFMCSEFFDIRTFGAVMTTFVKGALNCGQVRGPVQLGFARSIDPIVPQEVTITALPSPPNPTPRTKPPKWAANTSCPTVFTAQRLRFRQPRPPRDRLLRRRPSNALAGHSQYV